MEVLGNLGELVPGAEMTFSHQAAVCPSLPTSGDSAFPKSISNNNVMMITLILLRAYYMLGTLHILTLILKVPKG